MRYKIRSDTIFPVSLFEDDTHKSVIQNVTALLTTRKGTIPMYRDFGISMTYKDRPVNLVENLIATEVIEALRNYEPRAKLIDMRYEYDGAIDKRTVILEVEI